MHDYLQSINAQSESFLQIIKPLMSIGIQFVAIHEISITGEFRYLSSNLGFSDEYFKNKMAKKSNLWLCPSLFTKSNDQSCYSFSTAQLSNFSDEYVNYLKQKALGAYYYIESFNNKVRVYSFYYNQKASNLQRYNSLFTFPLIEAFISDQRSMIERLFNQLNKQRVSACGIRMNNDILKEYKAFLAQGKLGRQKVRSCKIHQLICELPTLKSVAYEVGKTERTIQKYVSELKEHFEVGSLKQLKQVLHNELGY